MQWLVSLVSRIHLSYILFNHDQRESSSKTFFICLTFFRWVHFSCFDHQGKM